MGNHILRRSTGLVAPSESLTIDALQSDEQRQLLNEIDKLRACGISDFVALPQLVVCGDQSSGKSSVLEAITEVPFPCKDNLCTRFATEIVLRTSSITKVVVKILPGDHRNAEERQELALFDQNIEDFSKLPALIDSAKAKMLSSSSSAFSRDVLSIEISGPNRPQLTIVDLPGLIHSESKAQTRADIELVSELCSTYISNPRTIILAVVTAKNDYANQIILKRARDWDHNGNRTLGIITKPDTLSPGSDSEVDFVNLAKNEDIHFRLGWHVVRNRGFETRNDSFAERNRAEAAFFNQGIWKNFPEGSVGITSLRTRLSKLLLDHIRLELPKVFLEVKEKLKECEAMLAKMGERRTTIEEQRLYLSKLSQTFYGHCKAAIDGSYEDKFFGSSLSDKGYEKRLRSVTQNLNISFSKAMRLKGHQMEFLPEPDEDDDAEVIEGVEEEEKEEEAEIPSQNPESSPSHVPQKISSRDALVWVKKILSRSRGRELPGNFNPLLIGELFWEQSCQWETLAQNHVDNIWEVCQRFVRNAIAESTNKDVFESLFTYHLDKIMEDRLADAKQELERVMADQRRHAMTYNHYYTDNVQNSRQERRKNHYLEVLSAKNLTSHETSTYTPYDVQYLLEDIVSQPSEADMDTYACLELLDCMKAYYKVSWT